MNTIPHSMQKLYSLTARDMEAVASTINAALHQSMPIVSLIGKHILYAKGKRLRPLLCVSIARMCGYEGDQHIGPAACMELLHSASLLHDDVIDKSSTRRGQPAVHTLWDNKRSILVGDYLFAQTLAIMDQSKIPGLIEKLAWCSSMLAKGELLQLYWHGHLYINESQYLDILRHKTAALFSVSAVIGGMVAGRPQEDLIRLHDLGEEIGMAFQIVDDMLDYLGEEAHLKKDKGRDFAEKKMTYPLILAIELAVSEQEKLFWDDFVRKEEAPSKEDSEKARLFMEKHDIFPKVSEKLHQRIHKANDMLSFFDDNVYRKGLYDFLTYCEERIA